MTDDLERALRDRIRQDEAAHGGADRPPDSLWDHVSRVAALCVRLGAAEGVDPEVCRLAGLFHDAGKFAGGYHPDDTPEEQRSVAVLHELGVDHGLDAALLDPVAEAIEQLYRDDPEPTPLAAVLFDADNLDKLGPLGVANFFVKRGLRGRGISRDLLFRLTVELTYARHAVEAMITAAGRDMARRRAPQTIRFVHDLLDALREDGLADAVGDFVVEQIDHGGLAIDVVTPRSCTCGGSLILEVIEDPGLKCSEIHLIHTCTACEDEHRLRFCRPRLATDPG